MIKSQAWNLLVIAVEGSEFVDQSSYSVAAASNIKATALDASIISP